MEQLGVEVNADIIRHYLYRYTNQFIKLLKTDIKLFPYIAQEMLIYNISLTPQQLQECSGVYDYIMFIKTRLLYDNQNNNNYYEYNLYLGNFTDINNNTHNTLLLLQLFNYLELDMYKLILPQIKSVGDLKLFSNIICKRTDNNEINKNKLLEAAFENNDINLYYMAITNQKQKCITIKSIINEPLHLDFSHITTISPKLFQIGLQQQYYSLQDINFNNNFYSIYDYYYVAMVLLQADRLDNLSVYLQYIEQHKPQQHTDIMKHLLDLTVKNGSSRSMEYLTNILGIEIDDAGEDYIDIAYYLNQAIIYNKYNSDIFRYLLNLLDTPRAIRPYLFGTATESKQKPKNQNFIDLIQYVDYATYERISQLYNLQFTYLEKYAVLLKVVSYKTPDFLLNLLANQVEYQNAINDNFYEFLHYAQEHEIEAVYLNLLNDNYDEYLRYAIEHNNLSMTEYLLNLKDININVVLNDQYNGKKYTPLMVALVSYKFNEPSYNMVKFLLERGAQHDIETNITWYSTNIFTLIYYFIESRFDYIYIRKIKHSQIHKILDLFYQYQVFNAGYLYDAINIILYRIKNQDGYIPFIYYAIIRYLAKMYIIYDEDHKPEALLNSIKDRYEIPYANDIYKMLIMPDL